MTRNFLKGIAGDNINLLMVAGAWNMAKWMREAILFLFALLFKLKTAFASVNAWLSQTIKSVETDLGGFSDLETKIFDFFSAD